MAFAGKGARRGRGGAPRPGSGCASKPPRVGTRGERRASSVLRSPAPAVQLRDAQGNVVGRPRDGSAAACQASANTASRSCEQGEVRTPANRGAPGDVLRPPWTRRSSPWARSRGAERHSPGLERARLGAVDAAGPDAVEGHACPWAPPSRPTSPSPWPACATAVRLQNQGLEVAQPRVGWRCGRRRPSPRARRDGERERDHGHRRLRKPAAATVAVAVVDEMVARAAAGDRPDICLLPPAPQQRAHRGQPELPISYDLARPRARRARRSHTRSAKRQVKGARAPAASGWTPRSGAPRCAPTAGARAFSFVMARRAPSPAGASCGRAVAADGTVGRQTAFLRSKKGRLREVDEPGLDAARRPAHGGPRHLQ